MVVEKSKGTYYEVLQDSSIDWHENSNDYMPFIKYTLGTIIKAYKNFEERFVLLEKKKGPRRKECIVLLNGCW